MSNATCHFCGTPEPLDEHHIVPRRFGGSDDRENIVTVCPTCHRKLEGLYNKRFYKELGVTGDGGDDETHLCATVGCTSTETRKLTGCSELWACDDHAICHAARANSYGHHFRCGDDATTAVELPDDGITVVCDEHAVCSHDNCRNHDVKYGVPHIFGIDTYCYAHKPDDFHETNTDSAAEVEG